jgi:signal transduction histidine kinase
MKLRARVALGLGVTFLVAGIVVLLVSALTYQQAIYRPSQLTDEILHRLGANRQEAIAYVRAHPDAVFADQSTPAKNGAPSVNSIFQQAQRNAQQDAARRSRLWTGLAVALMSLAAVAVGWVIAGRVVLPLQAITRRARNASATDLSARVSLGGRHDEIRELADTFDDMLERLERAFVAQRRFAAQVSHEIRTPLSIIGAETDLLRRDAAPEQQGALAHITDATTRAEQIISAILLLARSESGDVDRRDVDLDLVTGDVLGDLVNEPMWRGLQVDLALEPALVKGDRVLLERLVANLLSNAARHNRPGGWIRVRTRTESASAVLEIANSVPDDDASSNPPTQSNRVGLTIVQAVLAAHDGTMQRNDEPDRVTIEVRIPAAVAAAIAV